LLSRDLEEVELAVLAFQEVACLVVFLLFQVCLGMLQELSGLWRLEMLKPAIQTLFLGSFGFLISQGEVGIVVWVERSLLLLRFLLVPRLRVPGVGQLFGGVVVWLFLLLSLYRDLLEGGHSLIVRFRVRVVVLMGLA